jgi:hypothetical protein
MNLLVLCVLLVGFALFVKGLSGSTWVDLCTALRLQGGPGGPAARGVILPLYDRCENDKSTGEHEFASTSSTRSRDSGSYWGRPSGRQVRNFSAPAIRVAQSFSCAQSGFYQICALVVLSQTDRTTSSSYRGSLHNGQCSHNSAEFTMHLGESGEHSLHTISSVSVHYGAVGIIL